MLQKIIRILKKCINKKNALDDNLLHEIATEITKFTRDVLIQFSANIPALSDNHAIRATYVDTWLDDFKKQPVKPQKTPIKPYSLVYFDINSCGQDFFDQYFSSTFHEQQAYIFLGEIPQIPGRCIIADFVDGKILGIYDTANFRVAGADEL